MVVEAMEKVIMVYAVSIKEPNEMRDCNVMWPCYDCSNTIANGKQNANYSNACFPPDAECILYHFWYLRREKRRKEKKVPTTFTANKH